MPGDYRMKHVIKVGTITGVSGTGSISIPQSGKDALSYVKGAWIAFNATALGGGTTPSVAVSIKSLFSEVYFTTASVSITGTGETLVNSHESVKACAMGKDMRFDWSISGSPTSTSVDIYVTLFG